MPELLPIVVPEKAEGAGNAGLRIKGRGGGRWSKCAPRRSMIDCRLTWVNTSAEFPALREMMAARPWVWKSIVAGAVGSVVHLVFMYLKSRTGLLPSFQPYQSLQAALAARVGTNVPAIVPWALSFLNGMTVLGFLFARIKRLLPGKSGAAKGVTFGLIGWVFMGLIFFPAIGLGPFAVDVGSGFGPALLSLVMLQAYSIVLGTVYGLLEGANE